MGSLGMCTMCMQLLAFQCILRVMPCRLQNPEGKQLMLEAIALMGALLLALDRQIPGATRERAVVAYYRLKGGAQVSLATTPAGAVQQLCVLSIC